MDAIRECRAILEKNSKSFALAAKWLPRDRQDDAAVLYAWCRRVDDAIDDAPAGEAEGALESLWDELARVYGDGSDLSLEGRAFREVAQRRSIPKHYPDELLRGMEMDVTGATYDSLDDLLLYAHRVAGVVGLMCCHVLGVRDDDALPHAAHLGWAMQLTNISRDVAEDWGLGRLYLPRQWLIEAGAADPLGSGASSSFPTELTDPAARVVARLLAIADGYYASAERGLAYLSPRVALAIDIARRVYAAIGDELADREWNVTLGRAVVPPRTKARHVATALARGSRRMSRSRLMIPTKVFSPFGA
ncbi:MAG: phytoene/squalene synthase family protein [Myxococcota bacterium]